MSETKIILVPSIVGSLGRFLLSQKSKQTDLNCETPLVGSFMAGPIENVFKTNSGMQFVLQCVRKYQRKLLFVRGAG